MFRYSNFQLIELNSSDTRTEYQVMTTTKCSRCGNEKEPYKENSLAGSALGQKIGEQVCKECFTEWEKMQTMVINEHRLNTSVKEHRQVLISKLKEFLNLKD